MNLRKTIRILLSLALVAVGKTAHSEEQHSIMTAISSTTLSGYVDTSASWWVGTQHVLNDYAVDATVVETNSVSIPANLTSSTLEPGEPAQPQQTGSIWYKWTADKSGVARISTEAIASMPTPAASSTMPALSEESIFYPGGGISNGGDGSVGGVIIIGPPPIDPVLIGYYRWWTDLVVYRAVRASDSQMSLEFVQRGTSLEFDAQLGETFWVGVEVYERQPAFPGQIELPSMLPDALNFDLTSPAANDSFASNLSVADSSGGTMTGYALAATREAGEPDLGGEFSGGSVWFHYTAVMYGTVAISDISQNLPIAIFTGTAVSDLKLVAKSSAGGIAFLAEEGKVYHVAVYRGSGVRAFNLTFVAPRYRLYETTVDALFPGGLVPHFSGIRGATMLFYAKTTTGWNLVEVEPIVNQAADLLIHPENPVDGQLRGITIDETLPEPRLVLSTGDGLLNVNLAGIPGQTCGVSYSTDLLMWSVSQVITLKSTQTFVRSFDQTGSNYFYRVTQARPPTPPPPPPVPLP